MHARWCLCRCKERIQAIRARRAGSIERRQRSEEYETRESVAFGDSGKTAYTCTRLETTYV